MPEMQNQQEQSEKKIDGLANVNDVDPKDLEEPMTTDDVKKLVESETGELLHADGLTNIDEEQAKELIKFPGREISLDGVATLTPGAAAVLAKFPGENLVLDGLTDLPEEVARQLINFGGNLLSLDGVTTLTPEAAAHLSWFQGKELYLNGITSLPPASANRLKRFKGKLSMNIKE